MRQANQQSITATFQSPQLLLWFSPRAQWNWLTEATLLGRILWMLYHKLLKICPPPFSTPLWGKSGEGVFAGIFNLSHTYAPSPCSFNMRWQSPSWQKPQLLEESSFAEHVLWKSAALVFILSWKASKQLTPCKVTLPVRSWATKTVVAASERGYSNFVCMCLQTQLTMELNQKLTKVCPEDSQSSAFTQEENTYVKT